MIKFQVSLESHITLKKKKKRYKIRNEVTAFDGKILIKILYVGW